MALHESALIEPAGPAAACSARRQRWPSEPLVPQRSSRSTTQRRPHTSEARARPTARRPRLEAGLQHRPRSPAQPEPHHERSAPARRHRGNSHVEQNAAPARAPQTTVLRDSSSPKIHRTKAPRTTAMRKARARDAQSPSPRCAEPEPAMRRARARDAQSASLRCASVSLRPTTTQTSRGCVEPRARPEEPNEGVLRVHRAKAPRT